MSVALESLLAHPSLADVALIAGKRNPRISDVWGVSGSLEEISALLTGKYERDLNGCMLVLLSRPNRLDWRVDALLRRCGIHGISAILMAFPEARAAGLDAGSAALANRLGVAVLSCTDTWRASVAANELLGTSGAVASRLTLRIARLGLQAGKGLEETLSILEAELERPLILMDGSGQILRSVEDLSEADTLALRGLAGRTGPTSLGLDHDRVFLAAPVGTGFGPRSWVGAVARAELETEQAAVMAALEVASIAIGHRLVLRRLVDERDARHRAALLEEIRDVDSTTQPALSQRAIEAGWRLDEWHVGIRLITRNTVDYVSQRVEVESAFQAEGLDVEVVEQVNGWALWTSSITEPTVLQLADISARVRRSQAHLRPTIETHTGVGRAHPGAAGLIQSLGEAGDAARIAGSRPQTGYFVHFDRLGLAQLLLAWTRTDTFLPAAAQLLAPLRNVPGDLQNTLSTYLDNESSVAETAAVLGIHRNTVSDRITRVGKLLAVDLADPETRLALHLACRSIDAD